MSLSEEQRLSNIKSAAERAAEEARIRREQHYTQILPKEYGGRKQGLEPTRYTDWEAKKGGLISDF